MVVFGRGVDLSEMAAEPYKPLLAGMRRDIGTKATLTDRLINIIIIDLKF